MLEVDSKVPVHLILDKFLPEDIRKPCLDTFLDDEGGFTASKVKYGELDFKTRQSKSYELSTPVKALFQGFIAKRFEEIFECLKTRAPSDPKFEFQAVAHQDGDYYRVHIDTAMRKKGKRRLISCVYYLHSDPKAFSGGQLRLYSINGKMHVDIEPQNNRIVFFPSFYPHEVLPIRVGSKSFADSRFSITGWINEWV